MHADYLLSQISKLNADQLARTGQQHIELGELMVKLSETMESMTSLELAEHLPVLLKLPPKKGRPRKDAADGPRWKRIERKRFKNDIVEWMEFNGWVTVHIDNIVKHFNVAQQAVHSTINHSKYGPPAYIQDGWVILGEQPAGTAATTAKPKKQSAQQPVKFDQATYNAKPDNEQFDARLADQIHRLLTLEGSLPVEVIAARLRQEPVKVSECCRSCEWFGVTTQGDIAIAMV